MSQSEIEHSTLEIVLDRVDRVYRPGDQVRGRVAVAARHGWSHRGVTLNVVGAAQLLLSRGGMFDSGGAARTVELMRSSAEIAPAGKFPDGITEVPFAFHVNGKLLRESYHGVYVNVCYTITVECRRGAMKSTLEKDLEFVVEVPAKAAPAAESRKFAITPESLENVRAASVAAIPRFRVSGIVHNQSCPVDLPFTGEIVVEESQAAVRSIELQLVRAETVRHPDGQATKDLTEIQNVQIADGDVARGLVVPIYMLFPRLFTCPTVAGDDFKVEFEINLVVIFGDGYVVTENFPIKLHRSAAA
mmetsp:Transcript_27612/g.85811  ORF Transcript_27612/g.85811 Transcript_27612/m.85811 type:complete len:303 (+) Transcript_27612:391-1299(+)